MTLSQFDDIRPYSQDEIPAAMQRIAQSEVFPLLASFVYPDEPLEQVRSKVAGFTTTREFQADTMSKVNEQIIRRSITQFTCNGLEWLDKQQHYLFVSNHRDIMLDSSFLQFFLLQNGFASCLTSFRTS